MALPTALNQREWSKFVEDGSGNVTVRATIEGTTGDLTVNGDLTVTGDTEVVDTVTSGTIIIDVTDTEALLVRKDGDTGDIFTVNTNLNICSFGGNVAYAANTLLAMGGQGAASVFWDFDTANDQSVLLLGSDQGRQLVIGESGSITKDFDHATTTNPTLFIHSATDPDSDNTQWGSLNYTAATDSFDITTGGGEVKIGTTEPGHLTPSAGDLMVSGELEVDGTAWFDGLASFYGTFTFSGGSYGSIRQGVDDGLKFCLTATDGFANHHMIITSESNAAKDHDHETPSTDPTLFIHSATDPDTANDQWLSLSHNTGNAVLNSGKGIIATESHIRLDDNKGIVFGSSFDASWDWSTVQATENTIVAGLGVTANSIIFTNQSNGNTDHDHAAEVNPTIFIHSATDPDTDNTQYLAITHNQDNSLISSGKGGVIMGVMVIGTQGTDVASANDATLTTTGNYFDITGAVQINTLSVPTGVTAGTFITLQFDSNPIVKQATGGAGAQFALLGSVDFATAAGDTLTLVYNGSVWKETARTVI